MKTAQTQEAQTNTSEYENSEVYTIDSTFVGKVKCPVVDFDERSITGLLIENCNEDLFLENPPDELIIPYKWVRSSGDVILVSSIQEDMLTY